MTIAIVLSFPAAHVRSDDAIHKKATIGPLVARTTTKVLVD